MALSRTLAKKHVTTPVVKIPVVKPLSKAEIKRRESAPLIHIPNKRSRRLEEEAVVLEVDITPVKRHALPPAPPIPKVLALAAPEKSEEDSTPEDSDPNTEHIMVVDGVEVNKVRILSGVKKSSLRRLNTMFGQRSDAIIDLLEFGDQDGALGLISKSILQTLVDILPVIERGIRKSRGQRGVYQLNQTISQMREMCSDIQAYKDKSMLGATIVERHIRPSYLDIAVQITAAFAELEASSRAKMTKEDFDIYREDGLNQMKRNLADYIKHQYEEVSEGIVKSLT